MKSDNNDLEYPYISNVWYIDDFERFLIIKMFKTIYYKYHQIRFKKNKSTGCDERIEYPTFKYVTFRRYEEIDITRITITWELDPNTTCETPWLAIQYFRHIESGIRYNLKELGFEEKEFYEGVKEKDITPYKFSAVKKDIWEL